MKRLQVKELVKQVNHGEIMLENLELVLNYGGLVGGKLK